MKRNGKIQNIYEIDRDISYFSILQAPDVIKAWTPKGPKSLGEQLEVWASSYDVNFHCDFLKHFRRYDCILTSGGYNFIFQWI
jgi:hypothetical protein